MYLELHRATYTTQAKMKQGNRRSEHLLREAELWSATAAVTAPGFVYPYDELDRIWKTVLLHQFHDILPGSSIAWVHREAAATYLSLHGELEALIERAQLALAGPGSEVIRFNAASFARQAVPALGASAAARRGEAEGDQLRIEVDEQGLIVSIYDIVADREVLPAGARANLLQLHQDLPNRWDAWDVDSFYRDTVVDITNVTSGEGLKVTRSFGASTVTQDISLVPGERRIDFTTTVEWAETEKFLKVAFPLAIRAPRSNAETQFGHVQRPTHTNTSWDAARFEICAHRWIHVAEAGYGIAIANDSTYGHDVTSNGNATTVRLSLLRAPRFPDPQTDHGTHTFRYSLIVGADITTAIAAGQDLNLPIRSRSGAREVVPLVTVDNPAVVVEAIKLAEDRSGDLIVRLFESLGGQAKARLTTNFAHSGVALADLLERPIGEAEELVRFGPFQIVTLRYRLL
jgi:alpha-mannosidase